MREQEIPVILVANKCEGKAGVGGLYEAYSLGLGDPTTLCDTADSKLDGADRANMQRLHAIE